MAQHFLLDELAAVMPSARTQSSHPFVASDHLIDLLPWPLMWQLWHEMDVQLGRTLPPLIFNQGHWWYPDELQTIWDVVDVIAPRLPHLTPPSDRTLLAWTEAQIFVKVREVLVEALNVDRDRVTRQSRLMADLGAE